MSRQYRCPSCHLQGVVPRALEVIECVYCKWTCDTSARDDEQLTALANLVAINERIPVPRNVVKPRISWPAWEYLVSQATQLGYIKGKNANGMQKFLDMLAVDITSGNYDNIRGFIDARQSHIRGTDQWYAGTDFMRQRLLRLPASTRSRFGVIARTHKIYPYLIQREVVQGKRPHVLPDAAILAYDSHTDAGIIGPVLEAIGLRWLVPASSLTRAAVRTPHADRVVRAYLSL